jgi:HSP20-like domain of unknown function (DUF1813).
MDTKIMVVGSEKSSRKRKPRIRLAGFWLDEIGFQYNSLAAFEFENNRIVIRLEGSGLDAYKRVVKQVLASRKVLVQVRLEWHGKKKNPHLEVKGFWLEQFGFKIGSVIVVQYEYGFITIRLLDVDKL